ncbi:hypothetical protein phiLo_128 [Thermus phage phiLo]|nr:hypothetical protein phiLo_128 [Thermus phage phiLo]
MMGPENIEQLDTMAVFDDDGNVIGVIDLKRKVLHYAGKSIPFYIVAGTSEMEYPSYYSNQLLKNRGKGEK